MSKRAIDLTGEAEAEHGLVPPSEALGMALHPAKRARVEPEPEEEAAEAIVPPKAPKQEVVYFKSGSSMPLRLLSNFSSFRTLTFGLKDVTPAMEEALSKAGTRDTFNRIMELGWNAENFGTLKASPEEREKTMKRWKSFEGLGVVAKMAVKKDRAAVMGLKLAEGRAEGEFSPIKSLQLLTRVWVDILLWKFRQHPEARAALLGTGRALLIEAEYANPDKKFWGGRYDEATNQVRGKNMMGRFMRITRDKLREEEKAAKK